MMQMKDKSEKRLRVLFAGLNAGDRETLLAFAEFLASRAERGRETAVPMPRPEPLPRPEGESVIGAIKRLSASYPMLDKSKMLHETSSLVTQHLIQGRAADEVIDELEGVFEQHYQTLAACLEGDSCEK